VRRAIAHLRGNVVAYLALFFAMGGVAGAAAQPLLDKAGSVEGSHIEAGAVHKSDLADSVRSHLGQGGPEDGIYQGGRPDGSMTVTAYVSGGQVTEMEVTGDCAWPLSGGNFELFGPGWSFISRSSGDTALAARGEVTDEPGVMNLDSVQIGPLNEPPTTCPAGFELVDTGGPR